MNILILVTDSELLKKSVADSMSYSNCGAVFFIKPVYMVKQKPSTAIIPKTILLFVAKDSFLSESCRVMCDNINQLNDYRTQSSVFLFLYLDIFFQTVYTRKQKRQAQYVFVIYLLFMSCCLLELLSHYIDMLSCTTALFFSQSPIDIPQRSLQEDLRL